GCLTFGRLGVGTATETPALRTAIDDLGKAHHQTAHRLTEVRAELADTRRLVDPVATNAVREAVESMLALVSAAVADAQAAREESKVSHGEVAVLRGRV